MFLNGGIDGNGTRPFLTDFLVMIFTTPPSASEPYSDDIGPRTTSIRSMESTDPVQIEIIVAEDGIAGVNAFTVDENQGVAAVQTTNTNALTVIPFVRQLYAVHFFEDILQILYRFSLQVFPVMTLILAGASLRFCSTEDAVTTIVSPSSSTANTGHAQEIADKHSPTRTKGFNLNIPYLHEVTTKIKWVIAHIFFTSPCVRQHRGGLICMQVIIPESRNSL